MPILSRQVLLGMTSKSWSPQSWPGNLCQLCRAASCTLGIAPVGAVKILRPKQHIGNLKLHPLEVKLSSSQGRRERSKDSQSLESAGTRMIWQSAAHQDVNAAASDPGQ
eukprot:3518305-Amphidinium_carterae.1